MVHPRHYTDTYSDEDITRLCEIGNFEPVDRATLRNDLEEIAAIYRWEASKYADLPNNSEVARDLKSLLKKATRLKEAMSELPQDSEWALRKGIGRQTEGDIAALITGRLSEETPSLVLPLNAPRAPGEGMLLELPDLLKVLGGLEQAVDSAIEGLPKRPPGQLRDFGLRLWMSNVDQLWQRYTSMPFTRDVASDGEPITPAARFCATAFLAIEPDYQVSRIMREMKDRIRRTRGATGRNNTKNGS